MKLKPPKPPRKSEAASTEMLARARGLKSADEARALYRDWAGRYDADVFQALGVTGSDRIADLLAAHLDDRETRIIDLGCGTGQVGARLGNHGFSAIDGLDISPEMMAVAGAKGIYRNLLVADLNQPLDIKSKAYDAAVSAGTFTSGHVGPSALPEILRVVRPGGLLAAVIADAVWETGGFAAALSALVADGRLAVVSDSHEAIVAGGPPQARFLVACIGDQAAASP